MVDDTKENAFDTLLSWLKDDNYTIIDEKRTIVTSEFYAKLFLPGEKEKYFEIFSEPIYKDSFLLRASIPFGEKEIIAFEGLNDSDRKDFLTRLDQITTPLGITCNVEDYNIVVKRLFDVDVTSATGKQHLLEVMVDTNNAINQINTFFLTFFKTISNE